MAASTNAIHTLLHSKTAGDMIADRKQNEVLCLKTTTCVEDAVRALGKVSVLGAPVTDETGEVVGFVDMLDIAKYIVSAAPDQRSLDQDTLGSLKIAGRAIALVPIKSLVDVSGKDPFCAVYEENPASVLAEHFSKGIHRAILFNTKKQAAHIVSQSDVNRFLSKNLHKGTLKAYGEKTLVELGYASGSKVETIGEFDTVLQALNRLVSTGVSALAVVDAQGKLVGNFSASDLRGLYENRWPHLLDSVAKFLKTHSKNSLNPVTGNAKTSLLEVSQLMADKKLHHIWVVEEGKPTGIISLTDIMQIIQTTPAL